MNPKAAVAVEAASLGAGESLRIRCPVCGAADKTLSVCRTESGTVVWNCFRASCGWRGASGGIGSRGSIQDNTNRFQPLPYALSFIESWSEHAKFLKSKIGFDARHLKNSGVMWCPELGRYAFPIYDVWQMRVGWVLRRWDGGAPKAVIHAEYPHLPMCSFYQSWNVTGSRVLVVVEDIPSAVRVSDKYDSMAALSASVGDDKFVALLARYSRVVWAFDKDAYTSSIKHSTRYRMLLDSSRYFPIDKDFKDMSEDEIGEAFEALKHYA